MGATKMLPVDKVQTIRSALNMKYYERRHIIDGLLTALLAKEHIVLLGPPGAGKSDLITDAATFLADTSTFEWQLTRLSKPDELFGPLSIPGLENEEYRRIADGKLPEAEVAYLDEIFKCNSATLNSLLAAMEERVWFDNGKKKPIPLQLLAGASNEMPELGTPEGNDLAALWDRFFLRYEVEYIQDRDNFEGFLRSVAAGNRDEMPDITLTIKELKALQDAVPTVHVGDALTLLADIRDNLRQDGVIVSDRRWGKSISLVRASALLDGRDTVEPDDLSILTAAFWSVPEERNIVRRVIGELANPLLLEAQKHLEKAQDLYASARYLEDDDPERPHKFQDASVSIKELAYEVGKLVDAAKGRGRKADQLEAIKTKLTKMSKDLLQELLG